MDQGMELLNSLVDAEITGDEEHIVVNRDRSITVPEALKKIANQYDHNVKTVTFDCPRYWDGRDLSTMKIFINYMRVDAVTGSFLAENVVIDETDETIMHFDWTITKNVSAVEGTLIFLVCAKKTDETGNRLINHWNSDLNEETYVSKGMPCGDLISDAYPDIITQMLTKIDTLNEEVKNIPSRSGTGLTQTQINALDALFKIASYTASPTAAYAAFKTAFGIGVTPDETDKTIYQSGTTLIIESGVQATLDNTNLIIS